MTRLADWLLHLIDTYGIGPVLAAEAFTLLTAWCAIGAAWTAVERCRANRIHAQPTASRKETP